VLWLVLADGQVPRTKCEVLSAALGNLRNRSTSSGSQRLEPREWILMLPKSEQRRHYFEREGHDFQSCRRKLPIKRLPAAEVCREAYPNNIPAGHVFRNFLNLAKSEIIRRRNIRKIISENRIRLQTSWIVSAPCLCLNAGTRTFVADSGQEITLERVVQLIKGGYSHSFGSEFGRKKEVWQRGFTDHRIRDAQDFAVHREYIHQNPMKRRLI
jgi:hypothetical protein